MYRVAMRVSQKEKNLFKRFDDEMKGAIIKTVQEETKKNAQEHSKKRSKKTLTR